MSTLLERTQALAKSVEAGQIIRLRDVRALAEDTGRAIREIELATLKAEIVPWRYLRNVGTLGVAGQIKLLQSTVAIVGQGGLGGYVSEALARMGVGRLVVIDGDVFAEHNLNRQLLSAETNLGLSKVEAARRRIAQINSAVEVIAHETMLTTENLSRLLEGVDVVVDALDRLPIRVTLQDGAQALGIPMVHGSIAGFLGQVMTILPGDAGLHAIYGGVDELPEQGLEAELGTPATTPMMVAAWEAQEVVKILLDRAGLLHEGKLLRDRLLIIDLASGAIETLEINK